MDLSTDLGQVEERMKNENHATPARIDSDSSQKLKLNPSREKRKEMERQDGYRSLFRYPGGPEFGQLSGSEMKNT